MDDPDDVTDEDVVELLRHIRKVSKIGGAWLTSPPFIYLIKIEAYDRIQFKVNRRGTTVDWSSKQTNNGNCCESTTKPPTKCAPSK
jgi:hypothetical protein